MNNLPFTAQAVLAAYHKEAIDYIESWGSFSHKRGMAAALRAAADQVEQKWRGFSHEACQEIRAIAAELEDYES
jgi:hypothetical protein